MNSDSKEILIVVFLPILLDFVFSSMLRNAVLEYDLSMLIIYLIVLLILFRKVILGLIGQKSATSRIYKSGLMLYLIYFLTVVFGHSPSVMELLNI